jgi:hypothetical protein
MWKATALHNRHKASADQNDYGQTTIIIIIILVSQQQAESI